jgi:hypothetical protein
MSTDLHQYKRISSLVGFAVGAVHRLSYLILFFGFIIIFYEDSR